MRSIRISCLWALATAAGLVYGQPTITSVLDPYTGTAKLCPGGQAVITGTALGNTPGVTVGGKTAYNLVQPAGGTQITIEIPVDAALGPNTPVIVTAFGVPSAPFNITLVQYAPVLISSASGSVISPQHQGGSAVTPANPASPGENIAFSAIGLGPTNPVVPTGTASRAPTTTVPTVNLGANQVQGVTAGLTPGGIALYLVNFVVPQSTASGSYPISLSIGGATSNNLSLSVGAAANGPVITSLLNNGSFTPGPIAPGEYVSISGTNLYVNPANPAGSNCGGAGLPLICSGVSVLVNGKAAPIRNVAPATVVFAMPIAITGTNATVQVTTQSGAQTLQSNVVNATLAPTAPGLFTAVQNGVTYGNFSNSAGVLITPANPAQAGDLVRIVGTGFGITNPVVPDGTETPPSPPIPVVASVKVTVGGQNATVSSATLFPNGNYTDQVIFQAPSGLPGGNEPVTVNVGGVNSQTLQLPMVITGPNVTNVANAASNITAGLPNAGIAQGAIFLVFGSNLGPGTISIAQNAFQNTSLSGTSISVTVNGTTVAPLLYYTLATQIGALLPSNTPVGTGTIMVTYNGQVGIPAPITVVPSNLGIFTVTSDGQGVGIVTNADYSLVSVTPGTPCGGPYTTCGAANPGDTLIIWATGLGPVSGSDAAGAGLGVPMPNIPLQVWVGGVQATVGYQGRSGCCIGEDQIVFTVPANAPLGCAVPMFVQIGNQISNYTLMAVAPKGSRTCTPSNSAFTSNVAQQLTNTGSTGAFNIGNITLQRQPNFNAQGQLSGNTDYGQAQFFSVNVPSAVQPFIVSYLDDSPTGTCVVFNNLNGQSGGSYFNLVKNLDAGPSIKVTGPNGSQTIPTSGVSGNKIQVTLTDGAGGNFLSPGAYTFTGTGGADVGSFSAPYTIPTPPTLTSPASGTNVPVTRANGLTVTWSGGAANSFIEIQGSSATDNTRTNGASFTCFVAASAGTFTIPPSVLLALPPGNFGGMSFQPYSPYGTFSASGLNLAFIQMNYQTPIFTTFQ